jgi:hypothetical protein
MKLAELLREYDIRSENIRFGEPIDRVKGYHRSDFADAWARYRPLVAGEPYQPYRSYRNVRNRRPKAEFGWVRPPARYGSSRTGPASRTGPKTQVYLRKQCCRYDRYGYPPL